MLNHDVGYYDHLPITVTIRRATKDALDEARQGLHPIVTMGVERIFLLDKYDESELELGLADIAYFAEKTSAFPNSAFARGMHAAFASLHPNGVGAFIALFPSHSSEPFDEFTRAYELARTIRLWAAGDVYSVAVKCDGMTLFEASHVPFKPEGKWMEDLKSVIPLDDIVKNVWDTIVPHGDSEFGVRDRLIAALKKATENIIECETAEMMEIEDFDKHEEALSKSERARIITEHAIRVFKMTPTQRKETFGKTMPIFKLWFEFEDDTEHKGQLTIDF